ncbi:hypothetical protein LX32DRAFT_169202 [Colletotrichum zoysiae]|uniref:Uncharacterized protein n=1 Tax=Colletotrichum zoysiae TaxID=1216348 RepID=A0AAD9M5N8_9PEZI|nr:hypothetical protein LX32DRAFT_169202 [Colletotrichum zoysiae]
MYLPSVECGRWFPVLVPKTGCLASSDSPHAFSSRALQDAAQPRYCRHLSTLAPSGRGEPRSCHVFNQSINLGR